MNNDIEETQVDYTGYLPGHLHTPWKRNDVSSGGGVWEKSFSTVNSIVAGGSAAASGTESGTGREHVQ